MNHITICMQSISENESFHHNNSISMFKIRKNKIRTVITYTIIKIKRSDVNKERVQNTR
jgi:hypothetical protein